MVLSSWFNNLSLAKTLIVIDYSAIAKDLIHIEETQLKAHSVETFEVIFGFFNVYHSSQAQQLRQQIASTSSIMQKKQLKPRLQCARRMRHFGRQGGRLKLAGIKIRDTEGNSCIVSSSKQVQVALAEHWAPVYSKKVCGSGAASALLSDYKNRNAELVANFSRCQLPKKQ